MSLDYDVLRIEHSGGEHHTFEHINEDLLKLELPPIEELKELFLLLSEDGKPNYFYVIKFQV